MTVSIYRLSKGFDCWVWLCDECRDRRLAQGWELRETRTAPHQLTCDDCEAP